MAELLPWLNLLLLPALGLLVRLEGRLVRLEERTEQNRTRLQALERAPRV